MKTKIMNFYTDKNSPEPSFGFNFTFIETDAFGSKTVECFWDYHDENKTDNRHCVFDGYYELDGTLKDFDFGNVARDLMKDYYCEQNVYDKNEFEDLYMGLWCYEKNF